MKEIKIKKYILIFALIFLVPFVCLLTISLVNSFIKFGLDKHLSSNVTSYLFVSLIFVAILFLFFLLLGLKKDLRNKDEVVYRTKRTKSLSNPAFDYFYIDHDKIKDIDKDYVRTISNQEINENIEIIREEIDTPTPFNEVVETPIIENKKEFIDKETQEEINKESDEPNKETISRFYNLTAIDEHYKTYLAPKYDDEITLKEFCDKFRQYSAGNRKLYYEIEDIRRFVAGLAVTKLIILQGMSGTGKTSIALSFGAFLANPTAVIPVQPMWKERTDLVGYYNEFTKKFNETQLLYKMYEANYDKEIYVTVLDEMNIARIEYYFAEFLSLLEVPELNRRLLDVVSDKWPNDPLKLNDKGQIILPHNMWFIGTANNDDSTFAISDKVYDRAMVINLDKKAKQFDCDPIEPVKMSIDHLEELFVKAQKEFKISDRNLRRIKTLDEFMIKKFSLTFGNRIMKQIQAYVPVMVACGGTEAQAIDDILSRKVFRKLESKNPVHVAQSADEVEAFLDNLFGENKMPLCKEAIRTIKQNN